MNLLTKTIFFFAFLALSLQISVWPLPKSVVVGDNSIPLYIDPCNIGLTSENLFEFSYYAHFIEKIEQYSKLVFGKDACLHLNTDQKDVQMTLDIKDKTLNPPTPDTNEHYILKVDQKTISIQADNYVGFLRAIETLSQLIEKIDNKYLIAQTPITIDDDPEFGYRGILLDTSRHFLPKADILRTLDAMMYNKLNVFHWHITDDESFPLFLQSIPKMNQYGAYDSTEVYTKQDVVDIIAKATSNGIRVIPELDSPAHARSWGLDPDLSNIMILCSGTGYSGQLDPTLDLTYTVNTNLLTDVQTYFNDSYIHLGGDEIADACWDQRPSIKQWMEQHSIADYKAMQIYYRHQQKKNFQTGKSAIFWNNEEINLQPDDDDILQYWGQYSSISQLADLKNKIIISAYDYLYLDVGLQNTYGYSYGTFRTWDLIYSFNPYPSSISKDRILGAEACLWGEHQTGYTIDNYLWVRASALAERLWNTNVQTKTEIVKRLVAYKDTLISKGIAASPVYTENCELDPSSCF